MMAVYGRMKVDADATLTGSVGPFGFTKSGSFGDSVSGFGDLYPQATMRWNQGVHNFMAYATGDIPVGASTRPDWPISASDTAQ
jgi:Putative MetA-pathway of phenol degradation